MTFKSVKVYLLEISAPLLLHANKTKKKTRRGLVFILEFQHQQQAVCTDMVSPRLGTRKDPICHFLHYCIPLPPHSLWLHKTTLPIHEKCHHGTVCSRQNKQTPNRWLQPVPVPRNPAGSPVMSRIHFLFAHTSLENVIVHKCKMGSERWSESGVSVF